MSVLLIIAGVIFTIYGLILCTLSNFNLGVVMTAGIGFYILFSGIFYNCIKTFVSKGFGKAIGIILAVLICIEIALVGFIAIYGQTDNIHYNEDAVIILGAGIRGDRVTLPLKLRLDKAIEYHHKNPDVIIVVTGGQGFQETVTEAYAMKKYLVENGIDEDTILMEEKATSTNENMRFSKLLLDKYFEKDYKTVVITNNFHIYRGVAIAKAEGLANVYHMHCGLQWYNLIPCYLRESLAVLKMWVMG